MSSNYKKKLPKPMLKRVFDLLFSLIALLLFSWLIFLTFIIAALDTQSSGFFLQQRIGRYGKPFNIFKIKTVHDRTRTISQVGAFFRKTKLDELPQLFNVLIGDMSFVGPRPDVAGYYDLLKGNDSRLLNLKPGLTGPASIKYFNEEAILQSVSNPKEYNDTVIFPDKVRINLDYLDHRSFLLDLRIIFRTFFRK